MKFEFTFGILSRQVTVISKYLLDITSLGVRHFFKNHEFQGTFLKNDICSTRHEFRATLVQWTLVFCNFILCVTFPIVAWDFIVVKQLVLLRNVCDLA